MARLMCMYPKTGFAMKTLRCRRLSMKTSLVAEKVFTVKNPFPIFWRSGLGRRKIQIAYFATKKVKMK